MNKKIIICLIIIFFICIGVIASILLNNNKTNNSNMQNNDTSINKDTLKSENKESETSMNKKNLVLYFSATGTTKKVAETIKSVTNSDIIEIIPEEKYTSADLSYNNDNCRANKEQNNINSRPKIKNTISINDYDVIYLGYPIWWGDVPKIILTLLDNYNFEDKTIIPFCTSESSSISQSMNTLKAYNKNVNWLEGKRFNSFVTENDIKEWVKDLKINVSKGDTGKMYIKINDKILTATLENNSSVDALVQKLKQNDITVDMSDYSNFEKVGNLGFDLPRNDTQISTDYGDIILYQGNSFVIYYDKNNWNFTKLGHIDNITQEELKQILGSGDVTVTLSLEK